MFRVRRVDSASGWQELWADGRCLFALADGGCAFGAAAFEGGDVTERLRRGEEPTQRSTRDAEGLASAAWWVDYELAPGERLRRVVASPDPGQEGWAKGVRVFVRASLVLALWMLAVRPLGQALFRRFRLREQGVYGAEVSRALEQFPALRQAAGVAWRGSGDADGFRRWKKFLVELIVLALAGDSMEKGDARDGRPTDL